jgi:hypothetical protein
MAHINNSVGTEGVNAPDDVMLVQSLLNLAPPESGGPNQPLDVDGEVGPATIAAISQFQQVQFAFADGLVEPDSETMARLNELTEDETSEEPDTDEDPDPDEEPATDEAPTADQEPATDVSLFAGFDRLQYPGDDVMLAIINNTNLRWCGFYLAPAPSQGNTSWMNSLSFLKSSGWGLAPIYVGQQTAASAPGGSHNLTADQGRLDGQHAAQLATTAGFPDGSILFLDIEQGPPASAGTIAYYQAWVDEVAANTAYNPGVYCSFLGVAEQLHTVDSRAVFWVWNINTYTCDQQEKSMSSKRVLIPSDPPYPTPDPASSGVPFAKMWQYAQSNRPTKCGIALGGTVLTNVDFDSAVTPDPSDLSTYPANE